MDSIFVFAYIYSIEIRKISKWRDEQKKKPALDRPPYALMCVFIPVYLYIIYYLLQDFFDRLNDIVMNIFWKLINFVDKYFCCCCHSKKKKKHTKQD